MFKEYEALSHKFETFFKAYDKAKDFIEINHNVRDLIESKRFWIDWLKTPGFPVAFLGTFTAGKSSVVNALTGRYILPEAPESTTAIPTIVRKGTYDRATVYYLDEQGKAEMLGLYLKEIEEELREKLNFEQLDLQDKGSRIQLLETIREKVISLAGIRPIKETILRKIEDIVEQWDEHKKGRQDILIADLQRYVTESAESGLFTDRIEVHLKDINMPEDIILVDLPGLQVANERHRELTKDYIKHKAKAFVIVVKPKHLLEGEEIDFLDKINKSNPRILQRSFWAINQWDTLTTKERTQEVDNFKGKIRDYNFKINNERFFKVSSLPYLIWEVIQEGKINEPENVGLKKHLTKKDEKISQKDAIAAFQKEFSKFEVAEEGLPAFQMSLFEYLNREAKAEFLNDAQSELLQLRNRMLSALKTQMPKEIPNRNHIIAVKTTYKMDELIEQINSTIVGEIDLMRGEIMAKDFDLWTVNEENEVKERIEDIIDNISIDRLIIELSEEIDQGVNLTFLFSAVGKMLPIPQLVREKLSSRAQEVIYHQFSEKLLNELSKVGGVYLPDDIHGELNDILSERDILMRISGMADFLLFKYSDEIIDIGLSIASDWKNGELQMEEEEVSLADLPPGPEGSKMEAASTDLAVMEKGNGFLSYERKLIRSALKRYKEELTKFIEFLGQDVNNYTKRSSENHLKELKSRLLNLFSDKEKRKSISGIIASNLDVEDEHRKEQTRAEALHDAYDKIQGLNSMEKTLS